MFSKKSALATLLAGAVALSLAACGSNGASSAAASSSAAPGSAASSTGSAKVGQTVLKCSFNQSIDNPEAHTVVELSDKLYDATEGRYSIEAYPNEQLGAQKKSLELVESGAVELAIVANSLVENVNPDFAIIGCPYVYDSVEYQQKVFQSGALDDLYATTESSGFSVLAAYSLGPRCTYAKKPVTSPADLAGMKVRVMQSDTMVQMMNKLEPFLCKSLRPSSVASISSWSGAVSSFWQS